MEKEKRVAASRFRVPRGGKSLESRDSKDWRPIGRLGRELPTAPGAICPWPGFPFDGVAGRVRRGGGWVNGFTGSNLGVDWGWFFRRERCSLVAYRCWRLPNGFSTIPSLLISIFFFSR